jgi:preprotein translocase subunit SecE
MGKIGDILKFYDQVKQEVGKITWPKRPELINSALMVIAVVIIFSLLCLGVDYCINSIIQFLLRIGK